MRVDYILRRETIRSGQRAKQGRLAICYAGLLARKDPMRRKRR
jgi:hypothetical protein